MILPQFLNSYHFLFFFILLFFHQTSVYSIELNCRDPYLGGTIRENELNKYVVLGENAKGGGVGNVLIFYPAVYAFAILSGRKIIINDKSAIGLMCSVVKCGFPFISDIEELFPDLVNSETLGRAPTFAAFNFIDYFNNNDTISKPIVKSHGYSFKSDWWVYGPELASCVSRAIGCDIGDIPCFEHHAFQRLIVGPLLNTGNQSNLLLDRLIGLPNHLKTKYFSVAHDYLPRLDFSLHLRNQFKHFESGNPEADSSFQEEIQTWLNSSYCSELFDFIGSKVIKHVNESRILNNNSNSIKPFSIYIATDNEIIKDQMVSYLNNLTIPNLIIIRTETQGIFHIKDYERFHEQSKGLGILDLVLDWYFISMSNVLYSWRSGNGKAVIQSSFAHSAQKLAGNKIRSEISGVGTEGYQISYSRQGKIYIEPYYQHGFLDIYKLPSQKVS